ncbi:hypothetical protein AB0D46_18075 [Streptomyces sp. NPDC048383]
MTLLWNIDALTGPAAGQRAPPPGNELRAERSAELLEEVVGAQAS